MPETKKIQVVLVLLGGGAYTAADAVGGTTQIPGVVDFPGKGGKIVGIEVIDKAAQALGLTIVFYDSAPAVAQVDNVAFNPSDADAQKSIGQVVFVAGDYVGGAANRTAYKDLDIDFQTQGEVNLYLQAFTQGAPTYAVGDLVIQVHIRVDEKVI